MPTLNSASPPGITRPIAPQYAPLGEISSSLIAAIAAALGAPVTDPQGNSALKTSNNPISGFVRQVIVEVICQTLGHASTENSRGTLTVSGRATLDKSLRSKST